MKTSNRRTFISSAALLTAGALATPNLSWASKPALSKPADIYLVGPMEGFTPHIGTMLSMMNMMRTWVIDSVKDLSVKELDFQLDEKSNSIGAMLYHLAATERFYQLNTFEGLNWEEMAPYFKEEWETPMTLGEPARKAITGNEIGFYLEKLGSVRAQTIEKFKTLNDEWLMQSEPFFGNEPTNNYAKWFHVCEHESNHRGQIKFIKGRITG